MYMTLFCVVEKQTEISSLIELTFQWWKTKNRKLYSMLDDDQYHGEKLRKEDSE